MSENIAAYTAQPLPEAIETLLMGGDLTPLTPEQRLSYYKAVCQSLGLNPLTKPFGFLEMKDGSEKRLVLYALKDCTEQLRNIRGISLEIVGEKTLNTGIYIVTTKAIMPDGRYDTATGAVALNKEAGDWKTGANNKRYFEGNGKMIPLMGEALANAYMKCETKSKRRVTLSICGLGMIDESEVDSISGAERVAVDFKTGEIQQRQITDSSDAVSNGRGSIEDTLDGPSARSMAVTTSSTTKEAERGTQNVAEWLSETAVTELENFAIGKGWGVAEWNRMLVEFQIPSEDRIPARWLGRIKTFLVKPENLAKIQEEERVARSVVQEGVL